MASTTQSQPNGIPSSATAGPSQSASQPTQNTTSSGSATVPNTQATTTSSATAGATNSSNNNTQTNPTAPGGTPQAPTDPRPRDARTIELLLTSQGVTSFDPRVPLLLLDFAYRHSSSVLSDAIHLATDPYITHAGGKPSGSAGAIPTAPSAVDAVVPTNAINVAIASRQAFQFRGGAGGAAGAGGGGASKEWLQELARERNKVALPRVMMNEWGVRLPNERFVLSGTAWGLKEHWEGEGGAGSDEDDEGDANMEDVSSPPKRRKVGSDGGAAAEEEDTQDNEAGGGGLGELLGDDMADEEMEGME
ncbi:hypothetical protein M426DRAFT_325616 [Hypoxylon sp. CI-4A]|nr:hypothetical protein M426DRAFT_325616 [Hypoxylon sp. CI-4A]